MSFSNHDGTQTQVITATFFFNQDARQQTTDTAETVQYYVAVLRMNGFFTGDFRQFFLQEGIQIAAAGLTEFNRQLTQIDKKKVAVMTCVCVPSWFEKDKVTTS